jgi:hypothetical protein
MAIDRGAGADMMSIAALSPLAESGRERTKLVIQKWDDDQTRWMYRKMEHVPRHVTIPGASFTHFGLKPYEEFTYNGNLITRAGWNQLFVGGFAGTTGTKFSATVGRIGIGTGTGAAAAADTALASIAGLSGSGSNWILCGAAPTLNTGVTPCTAVFVATFGANDAVGAWQEFAIDQGTANSTAGTPTVTAVAPMMNHSTNIGAGTKAGGTWTATATLSFT